MNDLNRRASWLDLPNLDVAEIDLVTVILQDDMSGASIGETLDHPVFALGERESMRGVRDRIRRSSGR